MDTVATDQSYQAGRRSGFAIAALATSVVAFISLLGAEKAILALVFAAWAMREAAPGSLARKLGGVAVGVAALYLASFIVVIVVFHDKILALARLFQQLG